MKKIYNMEEFREIFVKGLEIITKKKLPNLKVSIVDIDGEYVEILIENAYKELRDKLEENFQFSNYGDLDMNEDGSHEFSLALDPAFMVIMSIGFSGTIECHNLIKEFYLIAGDIDKNISDITDIEIELFDIERMDRFFNNYEILKYDLRGCTTFTNTDEVNVHIKKFYPALYETFRQYVVKDSGKDFEKMDENEMFLMKREISDSNIVRSLMNLANYIDIMDIITEPYKYFTVYTDKEVIEDNTIYRLYIPLCDYPVFELETNPAVELPFNI